MIYLQLIWSFVQVGLFSVGGGYAAMPLIQNQVVTSHAWLTMREFTDLITIAEMTPGPIAVNSATFVGMRIAGTGGALAATLGCIFPSCVIVSLFALAYRKYKGLPLLDGILKCLRPVVVALILSAGLSILSLVVFGGAQMRAENIDWQGVCLFAAAFFALRKWRANPILVMTLCGAAGLALGLGLA